MAEATLKLSTVIRSRAHFIFLVYGQMGYYISLSFQKWLMDEGVIANIRRLLVTITVIAETIDPAIVNEVGIGGQHLTHVTTFTGLIQLSQPRGL